MKVVVANHIRYESIIEFITLCVANASFSFYLAFVPSARQQGRQAMHGLARHAAVDARVPCSGRAMMLRRVGARAVIRF